MRRFVLRLMAVLFAAAIAAGGYLFLDAWKSLDMKKLESPDVTTFVYDGSGERVTGVHGGVNRTPVALSALPDHVKNAFLAAEDLRFYRHRGVDVYRVLGALMADIRSMSLSQGASTITQQLIKLTQLSPEKTLTRKVREAAMALRLETQLSKDEILEAYLNLVYFGAGAYGVEAAAQTYFQISAADLTADQAALLAGVLKSPSRYAPHLHPDNALSRRNAVLGSMREGGLISEAEYSEAVRRPLALHMSAPAFAQWYVDAALDEAAEKLAISRDELCSGGYHIHTALDRDMQKRAEALFSDSGLFPPDAPDGTPVQGALAAVDPATGGVTALLGGREYLARGFHRATRMRRQPGSAFKPISVYAAAVDAFGYVPADTITDGERDYGQGYTPRNASGEYHGQVTLRQALSSSMNAAAVELISVTGPQAAGEYAQRLGIPIKETDFGLSMALGALTTGATPLEMASAYAALANGGMALRPHIVTRVLDREGRAVYTALETKKRAMKPESAYLITSMLLSAVSSGTARALSDLPFPVAAKTGTVGMEDGRNRDAWTCAYTPRVALAVWMGFDQPDSGHALPASVTGGAEPARLARSLLAGETAAGDFPMPPSVIPAELDKTALGGLHKALLAGEHTPEDARVTEYFTRMRLPNETSTLWDAPLHPDDARLTGDGLSFTAKSDLDEYLILKDGTEAAVLRGRAGETLTFPVSDPTAEYAVAARNRLLFQCGVDRRSDPVIVSRETSRLWFLFP